MNHRPLPRAVHEAPLLRVSLDSSRTSSSLFEVRKPVSYFLEPVVILDPIDRLIDRLPRLRPHATPTNHLPHSKYMYYCPPNRISTPLKNGQDAMQQSDKLMSTRPTCTLGFAGHRARVPPDPIPNSEVKPRSVSGCSVVFGHVNPGKLVTPLQVSQTNLLTWRKITQNL